MDTRLEVGQLTDLGRQLTELTGRQIERALAASLPKFVKPHFSRLPLGTWMLHIDLMPDSLSNRQASHHVCASCYVSRSLYQLRYVSLCMHRVTIEVDKPSPECYQQEA